MIRRLKNVICLLLIFFLLMLIFIDISNATSDTAVGTNGNSTANIIVNTSDDTTIADVNTKDVSTKSEACILLDAKSGKILYSKNADKKMYPASTTKLMTAILTLENCTTADVATVSHNAIYSIPVRIFTCEFERGRAINH